MEFLVTAQRWIRDAMASEMTSYAATGDLSLLAAVLPLGILFGSVHALTPGHSKTVLASYIAGSRLEYLRGLVVAGTLAFVHVVSAVVLALVAANLVTRTLGGVGRAPVLEDLSRGILVLIGLWLVVRALRHRAHPQGEGLAVAVVAGLVPCPLTLFAMFFAISRGVPEAGLIFALAMMIGVAITLAGVVVATVLTRDQVLRFIEGRGGSIETVSRALDATAGVLLIAIGLRQLLS
jgi:nickel/cobalt transporter (NicO) family protein